MASHANPQSHGRKLTYEDYVSLPDDGLRYELLDGDLVVTPCPLTRHQHVSRELLVLLATWVKARGLGTVYNAPCDVILDEFTIVIPDLIYVSSPRAGLITERAVEGPPDLVVEILSPGTQQRDRGAKMKLYARFGVDHYWIVDPEKHTVEVHERKAEAYVSVAAYEGNVVMRCPVPPGLTINLGEVWPR
jgi:Uma2 family endonuclease